MFIFLLIVLGISLISLLIIGIIKKKKFLIAFGIVESFLLLFVCIFDLTQIKKSHEVIGNVYGAEHQYISIGKDTYTACYDSDYHANDKDKILGCVIFENTKSDPMTVYSIKGVKDNEYIYTLWVYDGCIYKKDAK